MIRTLSRNVVLALHDAALAANGGLSGLRDDALLDSALAQPSMAFGGVELYPTLIEKAAALAFSLIANHPFIDGNKRVGWAAMLVMLELNGVSLLIDEDEEVGTALAVAAGGRVTGQACRMAQRADRLRAVMSVASPVIHRRP